MNILKQAANAPPIPNLYRKHGVSNAIFHKRHTKYGDMDASMIARLKELELENAHLKKMYAKSQMMVDVLREVLEKSKTVICRREMTKEFVPISDKPVPPLELASLVIDISPSCQKKMT